MIHIIIIKPECIGKSVQQVDTVVKTSVTGFDITTVVVVGRKLLCNNTKPHHKAIHTVSQLQEMCTTCRVASWLVTTQVYELLVQGVTTT